MVLVVLGHVCHAYHADYGVSMPLGDFFFVFHVPLFFVLSGMFFKEYHGFRDFMLRKTNKLLVPFFFFYFTTCVVLVLALKPFGVTLDGVQGRYVLWGFVNQRMFANGPLWFLLCLFWVNTIFYAIMRIVRKFRKTENSMIVPLVLVSLCFGAIGVALGCRLWMFVDTAFTVMPFFCLGYMLRKHTSLLQPARWDKWLWLLFVLAAVLTWMFQGAVELFVNNLYGHSPLNFYIGGACGSMMVVFLSKAVGRLPLVSYWGRHSLIVLCTHFLIVQMLCSIFTNTGLTDIIGTWPSVGLCFAATMLICTGLIPLCIRYIPWFTAQKDFFKITTN